MKNKYFITPFRMTVLLLACQLFNSQLAAQPLKKQEKASPTKTSDLLFKKDAKEKFMKVLEKNPNDKKALKGLGHIYRLDRKYPEALNYYEKYLAINSKDIRAQKTYAFLLMKTKQFNKSLKKYESLKTLKKFQDNPNFSLELGELYLHLNRPSEAEAYFQKVLKSPKNLRYKLRIGEIYHEMKVFPVAKKIFKEITEHNKKAPLPYYYLGNAALSNGNKEEMRKYYKMFLGLSEKTRNPKLLAFRKEAQKEIQ